MIIGIDIGGSHITAALIDEQEIAVVPGTTVRCRVNAKGTADDILNTWYEAIHGIRIGRNGTISGIGVAMPGPFDYGKGISLIKGHDKYDALYHMDISAALAARLGIDTACIRFRNDAEAFLLGEMISGAGKGYNKGIGITLGTGLGSAVHVTGRTWDAERWGYPFLGDMAEESISTRWFVRRYQELTGNTVKDTKELADMVATDRPAAAVFREFSNNLGLFLKDFIRDEQPEVVILGGNIANAWDLFYPDMAVLLHEELKTTVIKKAALGEEAALIGGACCWLKPGQ